MRYFVLLCSLILIFTPNLAVLGQENTHYFFPTETSQFHICSPLSSDSLSELPKIISDPYHPPPLGHDQRHQGVDFAFYRHKGYESILGIPVQSVLPGRIAAAIPNSFPFGNLVIVETHYELLPFQVIHKLGITNKESLYILYAHLQEEPDFQIGDIISHCQKLGAVGKSGNAGAAHLHLETRIGPAGKTFSSMSFYHKSASTEARQNYKLWRTSGLFQHFDPMELLKFH